MAALEERREEVNAELLAIYSAGGEDERAQSLGRELKRIELELPEANERWEELAQRLEDERARGAR